jgi:hypothetical protein
VEHPDAINHFVGALKSASMSYIEWSFVIKEYPRILFNLIDKPLDNLSRTIPLFVTRVAMRAWR